MSINQCFFNVWSQDTLFLNWLTVRAAHYNTCVILSSWIESWQTELQRPEMSNITHNQVVLVVYELLYMCSVFISCVKMEIRGLKWVLYFLLNIWRTSDNQVPIIWSVHTNRALGSHAVCWLYPGGLCCLLTTSTQRVLNWMCSSGYRSKMWFW